MLHKYVSDQDNRVRTSAYNMCVGDCQTFSLNAPVPEAVSHAEKLKLYRVAVKILRQETLYCSVRGEFEKLLSFHLIRLRIPFYCC